MAVSQIVSNISPVSDQETKARGGRRDRTRQALIDAGQHLIAKTSLSAVSIDEIVAEANVAKGTFYNHFVDKDELFNAIVDSVRDQVHSRIVAETKALPDPARKVARSFCVGLRYQLDHVEQVLFLMHSRFSVRPLHDPADTGIVSYIAEGIASGRFQLATTEAGVLLVHGLSGAAYAYSVDEPDAFGTIARGQQLAALLLRGLGLPIQEADMIAAQEADAVLRQHFQESVKSTKG
ncbi:MULTISPECIES: TetR/AcrR family transcriptional regulator [Sphingobium]|jgi:AcrR family transcriptional regulator|uniref:TetR/AcrR family transcriptional regulator n=1 Tax=Sphingobium TaxID=165695 RepID=UPI00159CC454|nr:TetR/AcrR family transcriptional regulator [Sphingobium sp. 15-1]